MARIGPNQDINDSTIEVLESLRSIADEASVHAHDHNNANLAITEIKSQIPFRSFSNKRFIDITTMLRKIDGSSIEISGFPTSGNFFFSPTPENLSLYYESVINTHIDQPERFRGYYESIYSAINQWSTRNNGPLIVSSDVSSQEIDIDIPDGEHEGHAQSDMRIVQKDGYVTIDKSRIPTSIDWSGVGPTDYNSNTYPQLSSAFLNITTEMGSQNTPFFDVKEILQRGIYDGANINDGFSKTLRLLEIANWSSENQSFIQASNLLYTQDDLEDPISFGVGAYFSVPIMVVNFDYGNSLIPYSAEVTMTPRNPSSLFTDDNRGFINKGIFLLGPGGGSASNVDLNVKTGSNTAVMNAKLSSDFSVRTDSQSLQIGRSLGIVTIRIYLFNQLRITKASFGDDNWAVGGLLSDININFSSDGHQINKSFAVGLERGMWP